jgi:predicted DsbA family dithiol-disulfide isomerase
MTTSDLFWLLMDVVDRRDGSFDRLLEAYFTRYTDVTTMLELAERAGIDVREVSDG